MFTTCGIVSRRLSRYTRPPRARAQRVTEKYEKERSRLRSPLCSPSLPPTPRQFISRAESRTVVFTLLHEYRCAVVADVRWTKRINFYDSNHERGARCRTRLPPSLPRYHTRPRGYIAIKQRGTSARVLRGASRTYLLNPSPPPVPASAPGRRIVSALRACR